MRGDWAIVWAGFGPGWFGGVDWPRGLLGLVGPGLIGRGDWGGLARFAGGDWRGFAAIGAGWLVPVDWGGVGPRAIGRGGAIGFRSCQPGRGL
jgi:hypothetical protein